MPRFFTWTMCLTLGALFSCQPKADQMVEFAVSDGLMNNLNFNSLGIQIGDSLLLLSLYTLEGEKVPLEKVQKGTPILLVTGSYTCDVTRKQLDGIHRIRNRYQDKLEVVLVNTLEAHPESSQSPYSAEPNPWPSKDNIKDNISAEQPQSMHAREDLAKKWIKTQNIQVPVMLDGPKNEFWKQAGQAPNMAILLNADGVVIAKQAWFEEESMIETIEAELE